MDSRRPSEPQRRLGLLGREPTFTRLFLATIGSGAGTWLALVALEIDVYERTGSSAWIAALLIADLLPTFAIGLLVGPLVDRLSRRSLMINADIVRFGAFAVLPFTTSATQVVVLAAVVGVATGFFRPAVYAGLPNLVQDSDLPVANSLLQAADNLTWALGSVAGGALAAAAGVDAAYWFNAATFLVSAALLVGIPRSLLQAAAAASRGHWQDVKDGFELAVRSRPILTVLIAWNVAMFAIAAMNVAEPRLALRTFSAGRFGLGLMMGCAGLGLTVGALLASAWIARRGLPNVYGISLVLVAYMLFFADSAEAAVVQGFMMGSVVAILVSMLCLLQFLNHPYHPGVGGLRPVAMQRAMTVIDEELQVAGRSVAPPCDAVGNPL